MLVPASFVTTEESNASIELSLMCFPFIFCCFGSDVMLIINQITYICAQVCQGIIVSSPEKHFVVSGENCKQLFCGWCVFYANTTNVSQADTELLKSSSQCVWV